jgi:hypothetical protein
VFWADGLDSGNRTVPDRLGCPAVSPGDTMRGWQQKRRV